tara:strand:+ start:17 stop:493 length:477 start_codon:yes stop_codon:yes gene_type:complete
MSHSITAKLNNPAREHQGQNGVTFFVSLGEKNYDFKNKTSVWTNYDAALFAKDAQIQFYRDFLVQGAVIEVSGTGIIIDDADKQYKPKLMIQDAKLGFTNSDGAVKTQQAPAPQQAQGGFNQAPQQQQGSYQQQAPTQQQQQNQGGFNQAPPQNNNDW